MTQKRAADRQMAVNLRQTAGSQAPPQREDQSSVVRRRALRQRREAIEQAVKVADASVSNRRIAKMLGVSFQTITTWLTKICHPPRKTPAKTMARKTLVTGICHRTARWAPATTNGGRRSSKDVPDNPARSQCRVSCGGVATGGGTGAGGR